MKPRVHAPIQRLTLEISDLRGDGSSPQNIFFVACQCVVDDE